MTFRGDSDLIAVAIRLINARHPLESTPLLGGGVAGFTSERLALATLAEVLDPGWEIDGAQAYHVA